MIEYGMLFFTAISCIAVVISIYLVNKANKKSHELAKENNRILEGEKFLDWYDIEKYAGIIVNKMKNDNFVPDYIIAPLTTDAIFASMIGLKLDKAVPIGVGVAIATKDKKLKYEIDRAIKL